MGINAEYMGGPQLLFDRIEGVMQTSVGYTQGETDHPCYATVCCGNTGHTEAVQVYYDDCVVTYEMLLREFWGHIDPTVSNGQGADFGTMYRTGIYYHTLEQKRIAEASLSEEQERIRAPIVTEIAEAKIYWPAEADHQNYLVNGGRVGKAQPNRKGAKTASAATVSSGVHGLPPEDSPRCQRTHHGINRCLLAVQMY